MIFYKTLYSAINSFYRDFFNEWIILSQTWIKIEVRCIKWVSWSWSDAVDYCTTEFRSWLVFVIQVVFLFFSFFALEKNAWKSSFTFIFLSVRSNCMNTCIGSEGWQRQNRTTTGTWRSFSYSARTKASYWEVHKRDDAMCSTSSRSFYLSLKWNVNGVIESFPSFLMS